MKYFALLTSMSALFVLTSCSKKDNSDPATPTGYSIQVKLDEKLSTGEIVAQDAPVTAVQVWEADGKDFEIEPTDALQGYAHDKISGTSVKSKYTATSSTNFQNAPAGKYFIFVMLNDSPSPGKFSYSYTTFDVSNNQVVALKKTFTTHVVSLQFEDWNASE